MFYHKCGREFESSVAFCRQCGTIKRREQESLCSSAVERLIIEHYFERGFRYDTIVHFLSEYHEIYMNVRTLKKKASSIWVKKKKSRSFRAHCSRNS